MNTLILKVGAASLIAFSTGAMADSTAHSKMHMMKTCMQEQKANNSKMSPADMKAYCKATINKQTVSSGPQDGTLDTPHK